MLVSVDHGGMLTRCPRSCSPVVATAVVALAFFTGAFAAEAPAGHTTETYRGHVVFLADAVEKQTGVSVVPEARDRVLALETAKGELIPLLEDVRARAFRRDERLRMMEVELVVRRYRTSPLVQVIGVTEVAKDGKYEIDYWCDICSIAMFEQKDCECCQEPNVLRRRKVD
jgi:hypothetical protein